MTTVKNTRAGLRRYLPDTEIIVAWWDKEWFQTALDRKLTDDEWAQIRRRCEKSMDYTGWADDLTWAAVEALDAMRKQTA